MLMCAVMFGFAVPFFFFGGVWIVPVINGLSSKALPFLPTYPLPASGMEGAFWRVLSVSMMAMLTWACCMIYQDVRRYGFMVPIVLLSKFCSTALYFLLFLSDHHLAYLVGSLTDGPIFLATLVLWFLALPADRYLSTKEENILSALGEALIPQGGAYNVSYIDLHEQCLVDVRRMLAAQDPVSVTLTRVMLRIVNLAPIFVGFRFRSLLKVPNTERPILLMRIENHRSSVLRIMFAGVKMFLLIAFFNQPEAAAAVGYNPEARVRP
jgi:hypothetical protein